ncbi:[Fe-Fe] hydrogenase large subunit C-terminal domain-containing protein [Clostridium carnis]
MNAQYSEIFKDLIKSYYSGNFNSTLNDIIQKSDSTPEETFNIITTLCGVDVKYDENYIYNLKKAITSYKVNKKIVQKLDHCSGDCSLDSNGKSKCQAICPFDAILKNDSENTRYIDSDLCMDCGLCVEACENGFIVDKVEFLPILELINNNKKVIATVAPAISGQFGENVSMDQIRAALIKIGFTDMIEVAFAADMLTIKEAVEFNKHVNSSEDLMITSCCCPMWVGMLKKVYKTLVKDLSPSVSPMIAAGRVIKKLNSDTKVVFIGPCIAKKAEAKDKDLIGTIDFVLTFEELKNIFDALDINPAELEGIPSIEYASKGGRLYARTGGVSIAVSEALEEIYPDKAKLLTAVQAEGVKYCKEILQKAQDGNLNANFIEGMGCIGGCVGGPKALIPKEQGKLAVDDFAYQSAIKVATHSNTLDNILEKLDITSLKDFEDPKKIEILEREF